MNLDYVYRHHDDPQYAPPPLEGTWTFFNCTTIATSEAIPDGTKCAGTITWSGEGGGHITQSNQGSISMGNGDLELLAGLEGVSAFIVQTNHATGAGCTQDLVNLITIEPEVGGRRPIRTLTIVKRSTCPSVSWKCSGAQLGR